MQTRVLDYDPTSVMSFTMAGRTPECNSDNSMSRRECLEWLSRAALAAAATDICGRSANGAESGMVRIADLMALRNEAAVEIESPESILSRTSKGIAVFGPYCTHKRHKLNVAGDGSIYCPVHDSIFDLSGKPQGGPATRALTWYLASVDEEGKVSVDMSKTVPAGQWAPLPEWAKPKK